MRNTHFVRRLQDTTDPTCTLVAELRLADVSQLACAARAVVAEALFSDSLLIAIVWAEESLIFDDFVHVFDSGARSSPSRGRVPALVELCFDHLPCHMVSGYFQDPRRRAHRYFLACPPAKVVLSKPRAAPTHQACFPREVATCLAALVVRIELWSVMAIVALGLIAIAITEAGEALHAAGSVYFRASAVARTFVTYDA